jgi:O-methyltransferase
LWTLPARQSVPIVQALFSRFRLARNTGLRFTALRVIAAILCPSYRMRYNTLDWMANEAFNRYLQLIGESSGLKSINAGRHLMIQQLLRLTEKVPGDTVECGVFRGASSYLICSFISRSALAKSHHMFDSFEGLSAPTPHDGAHWRENDLNVEFGETAQRLSQFKNAHYYKGWIPDRFGEVVDRKFSFLHIDVDLYEPTRDRISIFYPRINACAEKVCEEYGSSPCPGPTKAMDEYLQDKPEKMVMLSDGGGFLVKGIPTSDSYSAA